MSSPPFPALLVLSAQYRRSLVPVPRRAKPCVDDRCVNVIPSLMNASSRCVNPFVHGERTVATPNEHVAEQSDATGGAASSSTWTCEDDWGGRAS
ncbi:hypothetical protein PybrP1_004282 [[Pythium] brassicae (nom. inval.)]|nr:hypothetical protein PybrP1_004282 [[Pythium] brassicae (nom. inval.)]